MSAAREFLLSLERFGMKFGLANMARLCDALGHPERAFKSVLVAGTNGKGSVTAMVDTALRAAGHRIGRYTSPHLVRLEERFVVDGQEVDPQALDRLIERLRATIDALMRAGNLETPPTFFECTTAIAFELFRDAGVEVAVLEVGLGGRLDATNIVTPVAAAIVSIDFDHQAQLGSTLASIASEKAGIVKAGVPLVCGAVPDEARQVIERVCRDAGARLLRADEVRVSPELDPSSYSIASSRVALDGVRLALRGAHQIENARVAVRLLDVLDDLGIRVDEDAVRSGLTRTSWPGRLEEFQFRGCRVVLDAAHNPAGARALTDYLHTSVPGGVTLVFAAMQDKAVADMVAPLATTAREIICTTAPTPRSMPAAAAAGIARSVHRVVTVEPDPIAAVQRACRHGGVVVVAGSIFLIGPVREWLAGTA